MKIDSFRGEYRFLSNFWPVEVIYEGDTYKSVEHAYMAAKTDNPSIRKYIQTIDKPGVVKRFCKTIILRHDWNEDKLKVMSDLIYQKFAHKDLQKLLLDTGDAELIEGNDWNDTFWGICNGKGKNHLGKILMEVRNYYRKKL